MDPKLASCGIYFVVIAKPAVLLLFDLLYVSTCLSSVMRHLESFNGCLSMDLVDS